MHRSLLGLFVALALVVAACSSSDGSDAASTVEAPADAPADETADSPAEPAESGSTQTTQPAEQPDEGDDGPTVDPNETYRGVTPDTIRLGISIFDLSAVGRDNGDVAAKYRAAIDAINDSGGVLGRRIEPFFAEFSPLDAASGDAACVYLTEDERVFAVIGAQVVDTVLCYTELHDTIFLSPRPLTANHIARSTAPAISVAAAGDRQVRAGLEAMAAQGVFDGARVAVHASSESAEQLELAVQVLGELGVEVVSETLATDQGRDIAASRAEMSVFAQRWDADGATVVVSVGDIGNLEAATALGDAGLDMTLASTQPAAEASVYENYGADLAGLEGAVSIATLAYADMYDLDVLGVRECVTRFEEASGETVNLRPQTGEVANLTTTVWACQLTELFAQIAEAAGDDLTNESFLAAFQAAAGLSATAVEAGSGAPGKWYIDDSLPAVAYWDANAGEFVIR